MYDISAANLIDVAILFGSGGFGSSATFKKEDFSADSSPVRIMPGAVARTRIDMNKRLFPSREYQPVKVVLSPIPNTDTDNVLKTRLHNARSVQANDKSASYVDTMTIRYATEEGFGGGLSENTLTLTSGYIVDGNLGIDVQAEGRFASTPYVFEFAQITGKLPIAAQNIMIGDGSGGTATQSGAGNQNRRRASYKINPKKVGAIYYFGSTANQFAQMARGG